MTGNDLSRLWTALAGRYTPERELGSGGMATVHLAHDEKHGRKVAIKVLRPELAAALGTDRFSREIEIAAKLSHPHILPLFDSGAADGFLFYVMPYVEGESLRDRLTRTGRIALADAIRLADQVASALAYAHDRGVVHRDIKPENILLTGDQAIVADFGIARAVEVAAGERLTGTGLAIGTPAYMSPEQAFGTQPVDGRSDVYALGCVLYEMLAGRAPFLGASPQELLARHAAGRAPGLRSHDPALPVFVERAVARAMATDPADRFQEATELARALKTGTTVGRWSARRWRRTAVQATAVLLLVVLGWGLRSTLNARRMERVAVLPLANLTGDSTQAWLVDGVHEALISELAQLGLSVTARATMRRYATATRSIGDVARELGVQGVVEGSVFRKGDSLEIRARLYDAAERELWSKSYDGNLPNAVALYRGFARDIADRVQLRLTPAAEAHVNRRASVVPAVYEAYLKGMYILSRTRPVDDQFSEALGYFQKAIEANPAEPLAYTGLAQAYVTLGHGPAPPPDAWPKARAAADRALRLDSTLADAWSALAQVRYYHEWDWAGAERAFRRANELNPSMAMNHYHYAWFLVTTNRWQEALAEHRRAQELDPFTPLQTVWIGGIYREMHDYPRAVTEARRSVQQFPASPIPYFVLGSSLSMMGRHEEAIAAHQQLVKLNGRWRHALGTTYARAGRVEDARRIVAELAAEPPSGWYALGLAEVHAALGDTADAIKWLEFKPRHAWWPAIRNEPAFDALRNDPRFMALVAELHFPATP